MVEYPCSPVVVGFGTFGLCAATLKIPHNLIDRERENSGCCSLSTIDYVLFLVGHCWSLIVS